MIKSEIDIQRAAQRAASGAKADDDDYHPEDGIDVVHIAQICHEANRAYCMARGDHTVPMWAQTTAKQRESVIKGVIFRLRNMNAPISAQHEAWMKDRLDAGWTIGRERDFERKTSPNLVPFSKLPPGEQAKDYLFTAIVKSLVEAGVAP